MKKLLLSLALIATGISFAAAQTVVVFDATDSVGVTIEGTVSGNNIQPLASVTKAGVEMKFAKNAGSTQPAWWGIMGAAGLQWRTYADNTITVTAPAGQTITSVVFKLAASFGAQQYANVIPSTGTITPQVDKTNNKPTNGMEITWTASDAATTTFTVTVPNDKNLTVNGKAPQFQFEKATVTLGGGGGGPVAPSAPVIDGPATFYGSTATVSISAQAGTAIYYTLQYNGTPADPTTSSTEYEDEIVINNTATIKAIAVKDGLSSAVATATFTKGEAVAVADIAALLAQPKGTVVTVTGPVTVMGLYGSRYLFVQDDSGALQIFDSSNSLDRPYQQGQTISGFTGKTDVYNNNPQLAAVGFDASYPATASGTARRINPVAITPDTASVMANLNRFVYIAATPITKTGSNYYMGAVQLYNRFSLTQKPDSFEGMTKDAEGYAVVFNKTPELYYTEIGDANTLGVNEAATDLSPVYGAEGHVVCPDGAAVYTVSGMRVANASLPAGIYLVRHRGVTTKVVVR